ncbi:MAG: hypothetical protein K8S13_03205 [Desulfobacula sp.]|uniref:PKD domain-containing protein n=1 Tax=Desulfobacula sp. TaxID=2593537 RepID=UPI0025C5E0D0|nr:hypothetical protein [Desulfobacula sp.]MCD4718852.1 hypothetical protein [Desulfobacula sp.]
MKQFLKINSIFFLITAFIISSYVVCNAGNTVDVTSTSTFVCDGGTCERAGFVEFQFSQDSELLAGDWWSLDLPANVSICYPIDYLIVGNAINSQVTIISFNHTSATFTTGTSIPSMSPGTYGPLSVVSQDVAVSGNIAIRVLADQGSKRITFYVVGDSPAAKITVGSGSLFRIKLLDGNQYLDYVMQDNNSAGIYEYNLDENIVNQLNINIENFIGHIVNTSYASIYNKFTFAGDTQIAHIGDCKYPVSIPGPDRKVYGEVTLDGGQSVGSIVSWSWNLICRGNSSFNRNASGEITTISGLRPGFYDATLTVTDDGGMQASSEFVILCDIGIKGDFNGDGTVDGLDLSEFANVYGTSN